jgi:hypothetical protein
MGCQNQTTVSLSQIEDSIINSFHSDTMEKGTAKDLKRIYGLNANDYKEFIIYTPSNYMDVSEMLIIKAMTSEQFDQIETAIDKRINKQLENFGSYGPEQCALLENYQIKIVGDTFFFCVSSEAETIKDSFIQNIKI